MALNMTMTFSDRLPNAWWMEEKIDKLDFIKIKKNNFYSLKDNIKGVRWATDWAKIFAKDTLDKDCYSKYTITPQTQI